MYLISLVWRRLLRIILSLVAVSVITFGLLQAAPGNFADIQALSQGTGQLGAGRGAETLANIASRYGEDVPVWRQYLNFMAGAITWDFGPSFGYPNQTVEEIIGAAFPVSALLAVLAVSLALIVGVPIGVIAALRQNRAADHIPMFALTLWYSLPSYLAAILLMLVFSSALGIFESSGWGEPQHLVLPVLALALAPAALLARYVRSSMLETLNEEYVTAAYAKGGPSRIVIVRHVLRNSLIPLVTILGPLLAGLMTGTVFVETIFRVPGLGKYFVDAARLRDMPLLMGTALLFALIIMVMNLVVDLLYRVLDPRIRAQWK